MLHTHHCESANEKRVRVLCVSFLLSLLQINLKKNVFYCQIENHKSVINSERCLFFLVVVAFQIYKSRK